ncbi:flagellar basal body P-ring protein FlgI, partial [Salmonella enterica]|uniref:flagellar basal body P-ring protein FlgI n=1 Tax=Salmonella enterica TaxID=28901 RepID=UPI0032B59A35
MGIHIRNAQLRTRNVAAVVVTADLPPFIGEGEKIDVTVSSLGDAGSLQGGTLIVTPLGGPNGEVYAVAQGPVAVSGFSAKGVSQTVSEGV